MLGQLVAEFGFRILSLGRYIDAQVSIWKLSLLPEPSLKLAIESNWSQILDILIHGLLKLFPNLPVVCQLFVPFPWILWTTLHQMGFESNMGFHPYLAERAWFWIASPPKSRLPSIWDLETKSHLTKWKVPTVMSFPKKKRLQYSFHLQTNFRWEQRHN